ncbi:MAG: DNA replication/repair protein RecF [Chitinophagaceae bacterium]
MLQITHINLLQFRNYPSANFSCPERVTAICGDNGRGKTNLLDAVYYLCFTKSYFSKPDQQSVETGRMGFRIDAGFHKQHQQLDVALLLRENNKKELKIDGEHISPFSAHIGRLPVVFVAPDDVVLISGASEERRKLIDTILSQTNASYLTTLIQYGKILQERNKYLKSQEIDGIDFTLLDTFDHQLASLGSQIIEWRKAFFESFIPSVNQLFQFISDGNENPEFAYVPSTTVERYQHDLLLSRQKDLILQRTNIGIHKDDLELTMNGLPFKQMASQGQRKSMLFALKLAEFDFLKNNVGFEPILLLDDVFEKLDQNRLEKLLEWVCEKNKGQVFLTDTHQERISKALDQFGVTYHLIQL